MNSKEIFTAESVTFGHPDKFCDLVSDMVLDECLKTDPNARVACETYATKGLIVVGGEITSTARPDYKAIIQTAGAKAGYNLESAKIIEAVHEQSPDIKEAVDGLYAKGEQGAGDQGVMVGYACDDTLEFLPLEYSYAKKLTERLEYLYLSGGIKGIGSDGKSQVSAEFILGNFERFTKIVVSVQHDKNKDLEELRTEITDKVINYVFSGFDLSRTEILINPSGRFVCGGIDADTGLTGRKIVVDAYGPRVQVGGGAFSGKDPSKVDRSGAYFARYIARNIVEGGIADKCLVQIAYAIGKAEPLAVSIDTFGTGKAEDDALRNAVMKVFDFRPAEIASALGLKKPIYSSLSSGGHFGKDGCPWESADKVCDLRKAVFGV
jgi:S-adenosylmethionine synthetase